jgi:NADPH2:quinone reductase
MQSVIATAAGGPEVLTVTTTDDAAPGPGQLLVQLGAAGVNFIDTYRRAGVYPMPYPHVPGCEGAGTVLEVGDGVTEFSPGDNVAWPDVLGSYAERVITPADQVLPVPDGVDHHVAAAIPMQGMTAHYLVASTFEVGPGHTVLVHAAAGGVGLMLTQLATSRGARVIGTVSTAEKEALARKAGAADVIRYSEMDNLDRDLPEAVRGVTGGAGVHVVYDGVGKDTFEGSLASLRPRGMLVLFGASSGQVPPFDLQRLNRAGSLYVTRPTIAHHLATREELLWRGREVFGEVLQGDLHVHIGATFPLAQAADAHRALESRTTMGKVLLIP